METTPFPEMNRQMAKIRFNAVYPRGPTQKEIPLYHPGMHQCMVSTPLTALHTSISDPSITLGPVRITYDHSHRGRFLHAHKGRKVKRGNPWRRK